MSQRPYRHTVSKRQAALVAEAHAAKQAAELHFNTILHAMCVGCVPDGAALHQIDTIQGALVFHVEHQEASDAN